jgi:hypothetical protein
VFSDFTPNGARARTELQYYKDFFSNGGEPLTLYVFVTAKSKSVNWSRQCNSNFLDEGNMLGVRQLEEAVRVSLYQFQSMITHECLDIKCDLRPDSTERHRR